MLSRISGLYPLDASCAYPHPHLYNQNNASRHCSKSGGGAKSPLRVGGRRRPELKQQLGTDLRKQSRGGNGAPVGGRRDAGTPEPETGMSAAPVPPWAPTGSPGLPAAHQVRPSPRGPTYHVKPVPRGEDRTPHAASHPRFLPRHRPTLPLPVSGWPPRAPVPVSVEPPWRGTLRVSGLGRAGSIAKYPCLGGGFLLQLVRAPRPRAGSAPGTETSPRGGAVGGARHPGGDEVCGWGCGREQRDSGRANWRRQDLGRGSGRGRGQGEVWWAETNSRGRSVAGIG